MLARAVGTRRQGGKYIDHYPSDMSMSKRSILEILYDSSRRHNSITIPPRLLGKLRHFIDILIKLNSLSKY